MPDTKDLLQLSDFECLLNERFVFSLEGVEQKAVAELIKAELTHSHPHPGTARVPFILEFKFPAGTNIGQGLFQVETADGVPFPPMFLVPRGSDEHGWHMDSTFN